MIWTKIDKLLIKYLKIKKDLKQYLQIEKLQEVLKEMLLETLLKLLEPDSQTLIQHQLQHDFDNLLLVFIEKI